MGTDTSGAAHRIFVTQDVWFGTFGSIEAADILCQTTADNADLGGTWVALISDSSTNAIDHVVIDGSIENMLGIEVAADATQLWSGLLGGAITYTEHGEMSLELAWTGTGPDGLVGSFHCEDWTPSSDSTKGTVGDPTATNSSWVSIAWEFCQTSQHALYCISQ
jgi:hypothetical protein